MLKNKKKTAVITGAQGQDGSYLCKFLLDKGYRVIAADRRSSRDNNWRHEYLSIKGHENLILHSFDLSDQNSIYNLIKNFKIDEFYNLAAQSFVKTSFDLPIVTADITGLAVLRVLDNIKNHQPKIKFYQASSSEMFGKTTGLQNENTKFYPRSPYGVAKLFGHEITKNYRESYGLFACSGILFNHESPLRGEEFVTRKITKQLCEIQKGKRKYIELGNIYAKRDWGYAKDYVEAMWLMLQQQKPDDYVIATSKTITIKQFINMCAKYLKIDLLWKGKGINEVAYCKKTKKIIIKINKKYYRPAEVEHLRGSPAKAKKKLKWKPKTSIKKLVELMIESDMKLT